MKAYVISLGLGIFVGGIYGLCGVRSPAPPLIALAGLLGILMGEQAVPLAKHLMAGHSPSVAWLKTDSGAKALGRLPGDPTTPKPES